MRESKKPHGLTAVGVGQLWPVKIKAACATLIEVGAPASGQVTRKMFVLEVVMPKYMVVVAPLVGFIVKPPVTRRVVVVIPPASARSSRLKRTTNEPANALKTLVVMYRLFELSSRLM